MKVFAVSYKDARERRHVVAVPAETKKEAIAKVVTFQSQWPEEGHQTGFYYDVIPEEENVEEICPEKSEDKVQVLWHDAYD